MIGAPRVSRAALALAPGLVAIAACQLAAGIESRKVDPIFDGCELPSAGDGTIRIANLAPQAGNADFCVRAAGGAYFRPIFRGGGAQCPNGIAYAQVTRPFAAPSGSIDVKAIPAGQTCAAPPLSEALGVAVGSSLVVTIARIGAAGAERLVPFSESTPSAGTSTKFRFVHAAPNVGPLFVGNATDARLPTEVTTRFVTEALPFGAAWTAQSRPAFAAATIDPQGYLSLPSTDYDIGGAVEGTTKAVLVTHLTGSTNVRSLYAIGNANDATAYPVRGLLCEDDATTGYFTPCTQTALATLSIDMFNVGLYGANAVEEAARRPVLYEQLAKRTSDIQCLVEVSRKSDRDGIAAAAKAAFPFAQTATTNLDTPPTDPTDQQGNTPPMPTDAPCTAPVDPTVVDAAYQCMIDNCNTMPHDPSGVIVGGSDCLSSKCATKLIPLLDGTRTNSRCFDCAITKTLSYATYASGKLACTTDTRDPFNFDGQNPSMILSRYELTNQDTYVLPSWLFRRTILYALVKLEQGTSIDFFCAQLSSPILDDLVPYAGYYSGGDDPHGYDHEALLQTQRLIAWVRAKTAGRPAVIAGDWHSSRMQAVPRLDALNPAVYDLLHMAFTEALPASYKKSCAVCPTAMNAYNGDTAYEWLGTFLQAFPDRATTDASIYFDQPIVTLSDGVTHGMLASDFGFNVRVIRP